MIQARTSASKHRLGDAGVDHASPFDHRLVQDELEAIESFVESSIVIPMPPFE